MKEINFSYSRERMFPGFDHKTCKIAPQIIYDGKNTAFLTYQILLLAGSDVFVDSYIAKSTDGGKTFGEPRLFSKIEFYENGIRTFVGCGVGLYNKYYDKWLLWGKSSSYENCSHPVLIPFPFEYISACPFFQPYEYENGDMLITFYYSSQMYYKARVVTIRYALEGNTLRIVKVGEPVIGEQYSRGLCEPSLSKLGDKYYMTLRSDEIGLFTASDDGYHFEEPRPWVWDDGSVLENYNTQQRWVRHKDGLFLAYTRKGAHNDHVFRHRAPIFMTRFDEERQCLIRSEEVILVPELGARLGNFSVTDVSEKESWLITAEWMQPLGCEKYGSDNAFWRAKIMFE